MYAPGMYCETKTTDGIYEQLLIRNQLQYRLEEELLLPELGEGTLQICHGDGSIQMEQTKVMEGRNLYRRNSVFEFPVSESGG